MGGLSSISKCFSYNFISIWSGALIVANVMAKVQIQMGWWRSLEVEFVNIYLLVSYRDGGQGKLRPKSRSLWHSNIWNFIYHITIPLFPVPVMVAL